MPLRFLDQNPAFSLWEDAAFGPNGNWQVNWNNYLQKDPYMRNVFMCIEIVFGGGKRVLISTRPHQSTDSKTGKDYVYLPLLQGEPAIDSEYSLGGGTASQRSFSMSLDSRLVKPSEIISQGHILAGWAEISLQYKGIDYKDRFVVMRGDMDGGVRFASSREVMDFDVSDPVNSQEYYIPKNTASLDRLGFANETIGKRYPFVLGDHPYVPALTIFDGSSFRTFLVMGGGSHEVDGTAIYRNGASVDTTSTIYPWAASITEDNLGTRFLKISFSVGTGSWDNGDTLYVPVTRVDDKKFDVIESIEELISNQTLMGRRGINKDLFGRSQARIAACNPKILINGSGSSNSATAFDYVENTICSEFPMITMAWTCGGYGPVVTDRRSGLHVAHLEAKQFPLTSRATLVEETPKSEVLNVFSVKYAYNPMADEYEGYVYRDASNSVLCALSQQHVGRREMDPIEAVTIYDAQDAAYVVDWMAAHYALPSYYVEYDASSLLLVKYQLGDNIKLTDPELGWSEVTATIQKLSYRKGVVTLGLRVWVLYPDLPAGGKSGFTYTTS